MTVLHYLIEATVRAQKKFHKPLHVTFLTKTVKYYFVFSTKTRCSELEKSLQVCIEHD